MPTIRPIVDEELSETTNGEGTQTGGACYDTGREDIHIHAVSSRATGAAVYLEPTRHWSLSAGWRGAGYAVSDVSDAVISTVPRALLAGFSSAVE